MPPTFTARPASARSRSRTSNGDIDSDDAVGFILDMARSVDDLQLVAVGPLTNIALALRRDPLCRAGSVGSRSWGAVPISAT